MSARQMPFDRRHIDEDIAEFEQLAQTEDTPDTRLIADLRSAYSNSTSKSDRQSLEGVFTRLQAHERSLPAAAKQVRDVVRPIRNPLPALDLQKPLVARRRQTRRGPLAAALVLALVAIFALVFAEASVHRASFGPDTRTPHGLPITSVNITKSFEGMTLHLRSAYADANNIYLWGTTDIPGNMDERLAPPSSYWDIELSTSDGTSIPIADANSGPVSPMPLPGATPPTVRELQTFYHFLGSGVPGRPTSLHLTLRLTPPQGFPHVTVPRTGTQDPPTEFTFTVPFYAGQVVNLGQTATSHGYSMTLDRLVITPSETRAYFKPSTAMPRASELHVAGQVYRAATGSSLKSGGGGSAIVFDSALQAGYQAAVATFSAQPRPTGSPQSSGVIISSGFLPPPGFESLVGKSGVWTLKITQGFREATGEFEGDWEFQFVVPDVS